LSADWRRCFLAATPTTAPAPAGCSGGGSGLALWGALWWRNLLAAASSAGCISFGAGLSRLGGVCRIRLPAAAPAPTPAGFSSSGCLILWGAPATRVAFLA